MKVSVLYGDRLSPNSQEKIVKTAEQHMDNIANTTKMLKENRTKLSEGLSKEDDVKMVEPLQNVVDENQADVVGGTAIDNTQADQMMGVGRNLDVIVDSI